MLWAFIHRVRRFAFRVSFLSQRKYTVPVISVGNLLLGGSGKTPFTIWLSNFFAENKKRPMILIRGYRGSLENSSGILKNGEEFRYDAKKFGDEAVLIARKAKDAAVVVGKNRAANLDYYFPRFRPDLVILDDGYQHLKIARNLNIVLFDSLLDAAQYCPVPLGYMRENFSALIDADIVIFNRVKMAAKENLSELEAKVKKYLPPEALIGKVDYGTDGLYDRHFKQIYTKLDLRGKKIVALSGVASSTSFFLLLESCGCQLVGKHSFADHHSFSLEEIKHLMALAREEKALLVCTEKDMVKLRELVDTDQLYYLNIGIEFLEGEQQIVDLLKKHFF